MTLTPQMLDAMNKATGNNVSLNPAQGPSRADQIRSLAKTATTPAPSEDPSASNGFVKSLISAPATMLARPIQAGAELLGASKEKVNAVTDKLTHGVVAHVPENLGDVKKDVGRGIETVALGAGPESMALSGAGIGLGGSLEKGNDLFSKETAFETALGAGAGKLLGLIGKPVFNVAGKVIGEVTPAFLKDLAGKGTQAIQEFAAHHDILPEGVSKGINDAVGKVKSAGGVLKTAVKDELPSFGANKSKGTVTDLIKQNAETMTSGMKKEAVAGGRQTVKNTLTGGTEVDYAPTKEIERASEILSDPKQTANPITPKDAPNVVYAKTQATIAQRGAQAEEYLAKNPIKVSNEEDFKLFNDLKTKAEKTSTATELGAYDEQIQLFQKQLQGRPGGYTTENYYKALKDYEENVASKMARGKDALLDPTGVASAKVQAAADIRKAIRDMIGSKHPEFQPQMYDLASLYEAKDNALFNASKAKSESFLDKHPTVKKVLKVTGVTAGATGVLEGARKAVTGSF